MTLPTDDRDLDDYLAGGSDISRRYKAASQEQPSRTLDRAVLIEARTAGSSSPAVTSFPVRRARWTVPFALAATLVLSLAIFRDAGMNSHITVNAPVAPLTRQEVIVNTPTASIVTAPESPVMLQRQRETANAPTATRERTSASDATVAQKADQLSSAELAEEEVRQPEIVKLPPPPVRLDMPAPAAAGISAREERKAYMAVEQSPEEIWLADIRRRLVEGHKDQVREDLKSFVRRYPDYFTHHPEAAKPFAEFSELLKPPRSK